MMKIEWEKGFNQPEILAKIASIVRVDNGKVTLTGFDSKEYLAVLRSMLRFVPRPSPQIEARLVSAGVFDAFSKPDVSPKDFLTAMQRQAKKLSAIPTARYVLVTSLNFVLPHAFPGFVSRGCKVSFARELAPTYSTARAEVVHKTATWVKPQSPSFRTWVKVTVNSKSIHEAGDAALDALDLRRGIWNLYLNQDWRQSFGARRTPVNQIVLGPLHTLHRVNGDLVTEVFWYEPNHFSDHRDVNLSKVAQKVRMLTEKARNRLRKLPYREELENAILRYVRALDTDDHDAGFVKLWGVLEYLTDTIFLNYDTTIRRAAFMCKDSSYNLTVLEHLRRYRNRSVHAGQFSSDLETELYQLKRYVERLIFFHLSNHFAFQNLKEACEFMDLPADAETLKKQIRFRRSALRFIGA